MRSLLKALIRHPWKVVIFGTLFTFAALPFTVKLFGNLKPDIEELLPTESRSVLNLEEVKSRLPSIDNIVILIFSEKVEQSRKFVDDLSQSLSTAPKELITSVEYKISKELKFFEDRKTLYLELEDLIRIRQYVLRKIEYEKALYNPLTLLDSASKEEPEFDFNKLRKKYQAKTSSYSRFPDGYYATPDQKKRVVIVNIPGNAGISGAKKLRAHLDQTIAALNPNSYDPLMEIYFTGGVQNSIEEHEALIADLGLSTVIVAVLVSVAMFLFFKGFLETLCLLISLFSGTIITFGISFFVVGYLNANSAFLGSIVIGNGINFGIILLARFLEEKRTRPLDDPKSWAQVAAFQTAKPTLTAALAAGLSYGSLMFTGFRGFKQFGVIGLIGMVMCWAVCYLTLPPMLALVSQFGKNKKSTKPANHPEKTQNTGAVDAAMRSVAGLVALFPRGIVLATLLATIISTLAIKNFLGSEWLETDLTKLRNKKSMTQGSGYLSRYVDEIFQRYLSPVVVLPRDSEATKKIAERLKALEASQGEKSLIKNVQTIYDFLPQHQRDKISILNELRQMLPPKLIRKLAPDEQALVREFLDPKSMHPITAQSLPPLILEKFTEKNGTLGNLVLVEPPLYTMPRDELFKFVRDIRQTTDQVEPGAAVAGGLVVNSDLIEAITRDGPKATLFAFMAVFGLVIILFLRQPKMLFWTVLSLLLGIIWMGGYTASENLKINFLNFIALPITFGIGVDYAVNILGRLREEGRSQILKVIRETGSAVALCSFTTVTGYGSLLIADNQAFVSFGKLAVAGEITCLIAAMVSLPAIILWGTRTRKSK